MENLLIVESNLTHAYFLINNICKRVPNIRLYNVASTGKDAMEIIKEENVDIIVLDLELVDMNGMDIIEFVSKSNIIKYKASIIVCASDMKLVPNIDSNEYIFCYYSKISSIDFLINKLNSLIHKKKEKRDIVSIENQIRRELENLNFNFSYIGTKYLCECIYECYCQAYIYKTNLNKDIYPVISKKYHKTITSIKTDIFQCISMMYFSTEEKVLDDYFGYKIVSKPKTKEIITTVLEKISN